MALPKFTAEASLGRSGRTYRGKYLNGDLSQAQIGLPAASVLPNQLAEEEEGLFAGEEGELMDEEIFPGDEGEAELADTEELLLGDEGEEEVYSGDEGEAGLMDEAEAEM